MESKVSQPSQQVTSIKPKMKQKIHIMEVEIDYLTPRINRMMHFETSRNFVVEQIQRSDK